jgi:hypothetical protein
MYDSLPFKKNPSTITFKMSSMVNNIVTTISIMKRSSAYLLLGLFRGDSKTSKIVENTIKNRIKLSKCSKLTHQTENLLIGFSGLKNPSDLPVTTIGFFLGFSAASTSIYLIALIENL